MAETTLIKADADKTSVTSTYISADLLSVPANTRLPTFLEVGSILPVINCSSTEVLPCLTVPSAGKRSPGFTKIRSPFFNSPAKTFLKLRPTHKRPDLGRKSSNFLTNTRDRSFSFTKRRSAHKESVIKREVYKYKSGTGPKSGTVKNTFKAEYNNPAVVTDAVNTAQEIFPLQTSFSAVRKNTSAQNK